MRARRPERHLDAEGERGQAEGAAPVAPLAPQIAGREPRGAANMITTSTVASTLNVTVTAVELTAPGVRSGLVHGSISVKNTGCPRSAAASTRCWRGEFRVHAMRVSEAASEVHSGSAGWNLDGSSPAAANRAFQSAGGAFLAGGCSCAGMRSK